MLLRGRQEPGCYGDGHPRQGPRRNTALRSPRQRPAAPLAGRSAAKHGGPAASRICQRHAVPRRFQWPAVAYPLGAVANEHARHGNWHRWAVACLLPHWLQLRQRGVVPGLRLRIDQRRSPAQRCAFIPLASTPAGVSARRWRGTTKSFPRPSAAARPSRACGCRLPRSAEVQGWEDFGFKFKEGNDETAWDDRHGILTFRYTEPMTWWMPMPREMPRTLEAALAEARRLADQGRPEAKALFTSGYHDAEGRFVARLLDTPWCNGAVWSMNSMPGIARRDDRFQKQVEPGDPREALRSPARGDLDGEYIDSSEGYVTDELDFRRDHFAAAATPLVFSSEERRPADLPRPDRLRVRPRHRARHPRAGQTDDGQRRPGPALLAGPLARRDGHRDQLAPAAASGSRCPTPSCSIAGRCARASPSVS